MRTLLGRDRNDQDRSPEDWHDQDPNDAMDYDPAHAPAHTRDYAHDHDPAQTHAYDPPHAQGLGRGAYREFDQYPESAPLPPTEHELTLGLGALTGIFLAVVLICALFFGFGYSTGRTLHSNKTPGPATSSTLANQPGDDAAAATPPLAPAQSIAKPSAGSPLTGSSRSAQAAGTIKTFGAAEDQSTGVSPGEEAGFPPESEPRQTTAPLAHRTSATAPVLTAAPNNLPAATPAPAAPVSAARSASPAPLTPSIPAANSVPNGIMVQIAAVAHRADAEMLAGALRTNGYPVIVRTEPQDTLLHVQIGPFATREQAKAMRARLQSDGYNAFIKP